jgi:hypothetical protein
MTGLDLGGVSSTLGVKKYKVQKRKKKIKISNMA